MDLIRELKDVRFELNLRGYDCDAVDAFLAKVRSEIAEVQSQRESAQSRVAQLEEQLASGESDTEGTLRRTLILAQRLADETVADARQTATEMVESATADAEKMLTQAQAEADRTLSEANTDAASLRAEAKAELEAAHTSAERIVEDAEGEATRTRAVATEEAQRLLAAAERAGADRVLSLETTSQEEVARMREPIRAEVKQLEETRSRLLDDVAALEEHLAEQRHRVRKAVESLRVGMSGSIEDLERVAADDETFAAAARPDLSNARADDVEVAPDIEIVEQVEQNATPAPPVDQLAEAAAAEVQDTVDVSVQAHAHAVEDVPTSIDEVEEVHDVDEVVVIDEVEVLDEPSDATEPIPVVEIDDAVTAVPEPDSDEIDEIVLADSSSEVGGDVVDLDTAPSPLFGTDVAQDATVVDVSSSESEDEGDVEETALSERSFLERFTEAIDTLPIGGER